MSLHQEQGNGGELPAFDYFLLSVSCPFLPAEGLLEHTATDTEALMPLLGRQEPSLEACSPLHLQLFFTVQCGFPEQTLEDKMERWVLGCSYFSAPLNTSEPTGMFDPTFPS